MAFISPFQPIRDLFGRPFFREAVDNESQQGLIFLDYRVPADLVPASCSFKIPMICPSVKRLLRIVDLLAIDSTIRWREFRGVGQCPQGVRALRELVALPQMILLPFLRILDILE